MRTIKFRGKEVATNTWVYGGCIPTPKGCYITIPKNETTWGSYRIIPKTVGQFTSLFDKQGNEIYEGDILALVGVESERLEVRFVRGVFAFLWNGKLDEECPLDAPTHCCVEVIGNIHDNPELLKGGPQ